MLKSSDLRLILIPCPNPHMTPNMTQQTNDANKKGQQGTQQGNTQVPLNNNQREKQDLKSGLVQQGGAADHHGTVEGHSSES